MPDAGETIQNALFERFGEHIAVDAICRGSTNWRALPAAACIGAFLTATFRRNCCVCCAPAR